MPRKASLSRKTSETDIRVSVGLDGSGKAILRTPLPFLTHMVDQIARHGRFDIDIDADGDTEIDGHHTTEDLGLVLGRAVADALGPSPRIVRFGHATAPLDEARAACTLDLSGRAFFVFEGSIEKCQLGTWNAELAEVFFEAFARGAGCNLHLVLERGQNVHHKVEVSFKAFALALRMATREDATLSGVPSTKGSLDG